MARYLRLISASLGALLLTSCTQPGTPDMPPLSAGLQSQQDFYRFQFLEDGYPGRDDGWAHPLYGTYVLNDYLSQHEKNPTEELAEAIATVARAAVARMAEHRGALVFWYDEDPERSARLYQRHYSGLTQSYYAVALYRAGQRLRNAGLRVAADRVFDSLLIPVEKGGVLHESEHGPVIAEVPQQPNSWILNGWLSALASVHQYAMLSNSPEARSLLDRSVAAMAEVLPLYDVPDLANSRYGLTGFTHLRVLLADANASLDDAAVVVPGEGTFPVLAEEGTRWQNYFFADDTEPTGEGVSVSGSSVRMNTVFSLASAPEPNQLTFTFNAGKSTDITVQIQQGRYDPLSSSPVDPIWVELDTVRAKPGDRIAIDVPVEMLRDIAYPTNFIKELAGKRTNVYHTIHIQRLRQLAEITGQAELAIWADRWEDYICDWSKLPVYDGLFARSLKGSEPVQAPADLCQ